MATFSCSHFSFFIVVLITSSFINASTQADHIDDDEVVVVNIENELPSKSKEPLSLSCGRGSLNLKVGEHYNLTVKSQEAVECTAQWLPYFASWDAYNGESDKPHVIGKTIFWRVLNDGFYRSWDDRSYWKKIEEWGTD